MQGSLSKFPSNYRATFKVTHMRSTTLPPENLPSKLASINHLALLLGRPFFYWKERSKSAGGSGSARLISVELVAMNCARRTTLYLELL